MSIPTTLDEIAAAIQAGRISLDATECPSYPGGMGGASVCRDADGLLWVSPGSVRARHLPAGADPLALLREGVATHFFGFWRAEWAEEVDETGWPEERLRETDPEWFDGPEPSAEALAALSSPVDRLAYCGLAWCRVTGATLGCETHFWVGDGAVYAAPDSMLHYLGLGLRPRHPAWLAWLAEVEAGTLRRAEAGDLLAAAGLTREEWAEGWAERVRGALTFP